MCPTAKDAARAVSPDSSGDKEKHDTTAVAVPTGIGDNENNNKVQEEPNAPAFLLAAAVMTSWKSLVMPLFILLLTLTEALLFLLSPIP